ncbi:putative reverse transcriptase domain-containing protein, partial [Tanacetum coccineum]
SVPFRYGTGTVPVRYRDSGLYAHPYFDVIIGMDWLSYHRALIDCYEKIVHIPLLNGKILEVQGERPEKDLRSLACIKADEKKLDDIRVVRDFPEAHRQWLDLHTG